MVCLDFPPSGINMIITKDKLLKLAEEWAEYEEEHGTLILGFSLNYTVLYIMFELLDTDDRTKSN